MEELEVCKAVEAAYRQAYTRYRKDDEIEVGTPNHQRLRGILQSICVSFEQPIKVLEAGCGTGRYFHCLSNVAHLVGLDLSPEMLQGAQTPVLQEEINIGSIELQCGNIHAVDFPPGSFDFIYSLGMFGFGCPATVRLCNRFYEWLAPGGILFVNTVDYKSLSYLERMRKRLRRLVYAILPRDCLGRLNRQAGKIPFCGLRQQELAKILEASRFREFTVAQSPCRSPLWKMAHLECLARKDGLAPWFPLESYLANAL